MVAISTLMAVTTGIMAFSPGWRLVMVPLCLSQGIKSVASLLMVFRGIAGDVLSIIISNILILLVIVLSLVVVNRLGSYRSSARDMWMSFAALVVFAALIVWFTVIEPDLRIRMILMGIFAALFCLVSSWRMFFSVEGGAGTVGAMILFFLGMAMGSRCFYAGSLPYGVDFLQLGTFNSVTILVAEMLQYAAIVAFSWVMTSRWQATAVAAARAGARAARAREEAETRFQSVFRQAAVGIALVGLDGRVIIANNAFARLLGYETPEALSNLSFRDFSFPGDALVEQDLLVRMGKDGCVVSRTEKRYLHSSGRAVWVDLMLNMVSRPDGELVSLVVSAVDITARRAAEAALAEESAALRRSNQDLEQFAALVSHDLRAPVRAISGYLGLLARRIEPLLGEGEREYLDLASDGALRMDRMINGLLDYARLTGTRSSIERVPVLDVIGDVCDTLRERIESSAARVRVSGDSAEVLCDREMLYRVFQNLLDNALKYQVPGHVPDIRLAVSRTGKGVEVAVSDNGTGIPDDEKEGIFDLFRRFHLETDFRGTGIGLAASKKIVESMGGRIQVSSTLGQGSTFTVLLPASTTEEICERIDSSAMATA